MDVPIVRYLTSEALPLMAGVTVYFFSRAFGTRVSDARFLYPESRNS